MIYLKIVLNHGRGDTIHVPITDLVPARDPEQAFYTEAFVLPKAVQDQLNGEPYTINFYHTAQGWETVSYTRQGKLAFSKDSMWGRALTEAVQGRPYAVVQNNNAKYFRTVDEAEQVSSDHREYYSNYLTTKAGAAFVKEHCKVQKSLSNSPPMYDIVNFRLRSSQSEVVNLAESDYYAIADGKQENLSPAVRKVTDTGYFTLEGYDIKHHQWRALNTVGGKEEGCSSFHDWAENYTTRCQANHGMSRLTILRHELTKLNASTQDRQAFMSAWDNECSPNAKEITRDYYRSLNSHVGGDAIDVALPEFREWIQRTHQTLTANVEKVALSDTDKKPDLAKVEAQNAQKGLLGKGVYVDISTAIDPAYGIRMPVTGDTISLDSDNSFYKHLMTAMDANKMASLQLGGPVITATQKTDVKKMDKTTLDFGVIQPPKYILQFQHNGRIINVPAKATLYDSNSNGELALEFVCLNPISDESGAEIQKYDICTTRPLVVSVVDAKTGAIISTPKVYTNNLFGTSIDLVTYGDCFDCLNNGGEIFCLPMTDSEERFIRSINPQIDVDAECISWDLMSSQPKWTLDLARWAATWPQTGRPGDLLTRTLTPSNEDLPWHLQTALRILDQNPEDSLKITLRYETMAYAPTTQNTLSTTPVDTAVAVTSPASIFSAISGAIGNGVLAGAKAGGALALAATATHGAVELAKLAGVKQRHLKKPIVKSILGVAPIALATGVASLIPGVKDNKLAMNGLLMACGAAATQMSQGLVQGAFGIATEFVQLAAGISQTALEEAPVEEPAPEGKVTQVD